MIGIAEAKDAIRAKTAEEKGAEIDLGTKKGRPEIAMVEKMMKEKGDIEVRVDTDPRESK